MGHRARRTLRLSRLATAALGQGASVGERPIRWGILGTGRIARKFASDLARLPDATLVAVGSRSHETAEAFGGEFHVPHRHASYEALAADPDVEVVYVATPHPLHHDNGLLCLRAGKAVLCEKPFTVNAREAAALIAEARARRLFLMEAMWTRFLPIIVETRQLLAAGVLGELRMLLADFGFRVDFNPESRHLNPALGGGALLDVGVYTLSLAAMLFGSPERVASLAHLGETGVDEQNGILLAYEGGQMAVIASAIRTRTPVEAHLLGTRGRLRLHHPWYRTTRLTLSVEGEAERTIERPVEGWGYQFEAAEVGRCLRAGLLESPTMPLDETLAIMQTMDRLRAAWGLRYPGEGGQGERFEEGD